MTRPPDSQYRAEVERLCQLASVGAGLAGAVTMGFGLAGISIVATVLVMASLFQRFKRNRPDGYYQQRFVLWLDDRGLKRAPFVRRSGSWDIGRTAHATLPVRNR